MDSNEAFLNSHTKSLKDVFSHVLTAKSLKDAEELLRENSFDVVIYNTDLDKNNGFDTLAMVHKYGSNIAAIVYNSSPEIKAAIDILKNGAFDFLIAPFGIDKLIDSVKKGIENKKSFIEILNLNKKLVENQEILELDKEILRRKNTQLHALTNITKAMTSTLDLDEILHEIIYGIYNVFLFDRIIVSLIDTNNGYEEAKVAMGIDDNKYDKIIKELKWEIDDNINNPWMERLIKKKKFVRVENPKENEIYKDCEIAKYHPHTFFKVPLIAEGNVVGTLTFDNVESKKEITDDEVKTLSIFADHAGMAIEKARLYKNLKEAHEQLKEMQKKIIEAERLIAVSEVAASVNHEINNPLCSISLNIEILKKKYIDDEKKISEKLDIIEEDIERIKNITSKLANIKQLAVTNYDKETKMIDITRSTSLNDE